MRALSMMRVLLVPMLSLALVGCMSAQKHYEQTHGAKERELTTGTVQKEIRKGMSGAEVAEALGSPNIVTTDAEGREVWIYDKVYSDVTYSRSSGGGIIGLIIGGITGGTTIGGGGAGSYEGEAGAQSTTQRTLTVVIKFDEEKKVRDFAYHSSRF